MTSKIVVNNIEPDAGISTVTVVGNVESTKFVGAVEGSVTGNVTGNLTGTASTSTNAATAYAIDSAASLNTSGIVTATSFVPTVGQLSHRNLIINGAMQVAQRGTSTTSDGYQFLDRWQTSAGNLSTGQNVVRSQQSLSSSDTGPFEAGFRKYARIATGAAGTIAANSYLDFYHHIEAQNVSNSGWNYQSTSSYITVSFWLRCSTNQTFYLLLRSRDGTEQAYVIPITASANNTWTKITKTVPGNSNIVIDDNNGTGFTVAFLIAYGTDSTDNSRAVNTWAAHSGSTLAPDMDSTWLTAGASTFDVTGVQLEVGPVATPFEHRSFADELSRCQRYFAKARTRICFNGVSGRYGFRTLGQFNMRAAPTVTGSFATQGLGSIQGYGSDATSTDVRQIYVQTTAGSGLDGTITYEASSEL